MQLQALYEGMEAADRGAQGLHLLSEQFASYHSVRQQAPPKALKPLRLPASGQAGASGPEHPRPQAPEPSDLQSGLPVRALRRSNESIPTRADLHMTVGLKWTLLGAHCEQCGEPMERRGGECGEANCDCHREQVYVHSSDGLIGCGGMRRIGVTGGRDYNDQVVVATAIASNALAGDIIVHGAARGADTLAHTAAPLFD